MEEHWVVDPQGLQGRSSPFSGGKFSPISGHPFSGGKFSSPIVSSAVTDPKTAIFRAAQPRRAPHPPGTDAPPLLCMLNEPAADAQPGGHTPAALWSPTVFAQSLCSPLVTDMKANGAFAEDATPSTAPTRSTPPTPPLHPVPKPDDSDEVGAAANRIAAEILRKQCTTLMIRNLPNKLTPPMIMECVHELGFEEEYDYLFVPIDTNAPGWANRNLGYCFLNLSSPEVARRFCLLAYGYSFRQAVSSTKTSKISIAEEQGVLLNLRRIDRPGPRKENRGGGKHSSYPFVRVDGCMQTISPAAALEILEGREEAAAP